MINCPKCGREFTCTCHNAKPVSDPVQPCAVKPGGLWVQVLDDLGQGIQGVSVSADGVKTTDSGGFASWDPLPAKTYQVELQPLSDQLKEKYQLPAKTSTDATVTDGAIAYVTFTLTRLPLTWIEIVMVGEDNSPVTDVKYRITLPNSEVREGSLDGTGKVRIDNIPPGQCEVTFPELDTEAWSKA